MKFFGRGVVQNIIQLPGNLANKKYKEEREKKRYIEISYLENVHAANREARARLNGFKSQLKEISKVKRHRLIANRIREASKLEGSVQSYFIMLYNRKWRGKILASGYNDIKCIRKLCSA